MARIEVTITGVSPLMCSRYPDHGEAIDQSKDRPPRGVCEQKVYRTPDGKKVGIPTDMLYASIIDAGRFHKHKACKVTTQKTSLVPAGVWMEGDFAVLTPQQWEVDSRSVVNAKMGRVPCHRPRWDVWKLSFVLLVDTTMFATSFVRKLVDDAGCKCGLGAYRPNRKGPYGRFRVDKWRVVLPKGKKVRKKSAAAAG